MPRIIHTYFMYATVTLSYSVAATAAPVIETNQANFLASVGDTLIEDFNSESLASGLSSPFSTGILTISAPTTTILSVQGASSTQTAIDGTMHLTATPADGINPPPVGRIRFELPTPTTFFGFTISDWGDATARPENLNRSLTLFTSEGEGQNGIVLDTLDSFRSDGSQLFYGYRQLIPTSYVEIDISTINDGVGFDNIITAVPEPSAALVLGGLGLLIGSRSRPNVR